MSPESMPRARRVPSFVPQVYLGGAEAGNCPGGDSEEKEGGGGGEGGGIAVLGFGTPERGIGLIQCIYCGGPEVRENSPHAGGTLAYRLDRGLGSRSLRRRASCSCGRSCGRALYGRGVHIGRFRLRGRSSVRRSETSRGRGLPQGRPTLDSRGSVIRRRRNSKNGQTESFEAERAG